MAESIAYTQNSLGTCLLFNILRTMLRMLLFFLFATPFCCGDLGTVRRWRIPFSSQKILNSFDVNYPHLSDQMALIVPVIFFHKSLKFFKNSKHLRFFFKKIYQCLSAKIIDKEEKIIILTKL